jgi:hypothetical protein
MAEERLKSESRGVAGTEGAGMGGDMMGIAEEMMKDPAFVQMAQVLSHRSVLCSPQKHLPCCLGTQHFEHHVASGCHEQSDDDG